MNTNTQPSSPQFGDDPPGNLVEAEVEEQTAVEDEAVSGSGLDAVTPADDPIVFEQRIRLQATREQRRQRLLRTVRQTVVLAVFICVLALAYSVYKQFGSAIDDAQSDWPVIGSILPGSDDLKMPPVSDIVSGIFEQPRGTDEAFWSIVAKEAAFTLREAAAGFRYRSAGRFGYRRAVDHLQSSRACSGASCDRQPDDSTDCYRSDHCDLGAQKASISCLLNGRTGCRCRLSPPTSRFFQ